MMVHHASRPLAWLAVLTAAFVLWCHDGHRPAHAAVLAGPGTAAATETTALGSAVDASATLAPECAVFVTSSKRPEVEALAQLNTLPVHALPAVDFASPPGQPHAVATPRPAPTAPIPCAGLVQQAVLIRI